MRRPLLSTTILLIGATIFVTWPQALHLATRVPAHDDSLFSIWRLCWIAHALPSGGSLFDANIFYPHVRTLALSDATLLEALIAAPFLWMGVNKVLVYNLVFMSGIVSSGVGMFVLARYLTRDVAAALVAALIFAVTPYRIEHFVHLELQWTVWMPLTIWALYRAFDEGTIRWGALTGLFLWLQFISCVYYGAFLAVIVSVLALMLAAARPRDAMRALGPLALGAALTAALTLPYALPYLANTRELGPRPWSEVAMFSANRFSYFTAPHENWLWGWSGESTFGNELHLFPGIVPMVLAALGLLDRPRRTPFMFLILMCAAVTLSFGINSPIYNWLYEHIGAFRGFRAPARFAILAWCAMSVLAAFGVQWLRRATVSPSGRRLMLATVAVAVCLEAGSAPLALTPQPTAIPPIYQFMRTLPRSVILELPHQDFDPTYMFWSTYHWHALVSGYSGYKPWDVMETMKLMDSLPNDEAIAHLEELGTQYVLVHQTFYRPRDYLKLMEGLARRHELLPAGQYRDWTGGYTQIFALRKGGTTPH